MMAILRKSVLFMLFLCEFSVKGMFLVGGDREEIYYIPTQRTTQRRPNVELYLIRHAHALALGERGITNDEDRPLSEEGEAQAVAAAKALAQRGVVLDKLYTSPLVRARRTAEIMAETWER